jgi:hypothetical protein
MNLPPIRVTDHAVLRYLERALGLDVEGMRVKIAALCQDACDAGALSIKTHGAVFVFEGRAVVTVLPEGGRPKRKNGDK